MAVYYISQEGDVLDLICWRYYVLGKNTLWNANASSLTPQEAQMLLTNGQDVSRSGISGIFEKVLDANPGLAKHVVLPPGIKILLPDISQQTNEIDNAHLWD